MILDAFINTEPGFQPQSRENRHAAGAVLDASRCQQGRHIQAEALAVDKQLGGYAQAHSSVDIAGSLIGKDITARSVTQVSVDSGLLSEFFSTAELRSMDRQGQAFQRRLDR